MTEKEAQRELARIEAELERAVAEFVAVPRAVERGPALLKTTAAALARTRAQCAAAAGNGGALRPGLEAIQQQVRRVQLLLESAALFYCGCVAVTRTQGAGYTPEGHLEEFAVGGRMQLEA